MRLGNPCLISNNACYLCIVTPLSIRRKKATVCKNYFLDIMRFNYIKQSKTSTNPYSMIDNRHQPIQVVCRTIYVCIVGMPFSSHWLSPLSFFFSSCGLGRCVGKKLRITFCPNGNLRFLERPFLIHKIAIQLFEKSQKYTWMEFLIQWKTEWVCYH